MNTTQVTQKHPSQTNIPSHQTSRSLILLSGGYREVTTWWDKAGVRHTAITQIVDYSKITLQ